MSIPELKVYILDEDLNPVLATDPEQWQEWHGGQKADLNRRIAYTKFPGTEISTVFLGLDYRLSDTKGEPLVFETMVFGGDFDGEVERYSSWDAALDGHLRLVNIIRLSVLEKRKP